MYRLLFFLYILTLCIVFSSSCQNERERQGAQFEGDAASKTELQQVNAELSRTKRLTPESFEKLKSLRERYGSVPEIAQTYKAALISREDWTALESFLDETLGSDASREDKLLKARVYVRLGKFAESWKILESLGVEQSDDLELRSMAALVRFNLGKLPEAGADLDRVWDEIISQKRVDDISLRGLIYFRTREYDKAIQTLQKSLEFQPGNAVATNTLSRIYAATGDETNAESYRLLTLKAHDENTKSTGNKMLGVSLSKKLQTAWNARRYSEVLLLANQLLPIADEKNKPVLLEYIRKSEEALEKHQ